MAKTEVERSSGNVFEDLGVPQAATALAKAELARRIASIIEDRGLTQTEGGKVLGVDQAKVSAVLRGDLRGFSTERLFRFLNALDRDVEIVVKTARRGKRPTVRVVSATRSGTTK